ncbi:MAG: hypothetical protein V3T51_05875 [Gammaproteobacteria bacterium]|jgi:hypothetical protein
MVLSLERQYNPKAGESGAGKGCRWCRGLAKTCERSRVPRYVQIAAAQRQRIEDGRWSALQGQQVV